MVRRIVEYGMEYTIELDDDTGELDVTDCSGTRPNGLRDVGPWENEQDAVDAVSEMGLERAAE